MPIVTLSTLDGSSVEIDSRLPFTSRGATKFVVATIAGSLQEFVSGDLEFGDLVAEGNDVNFDEEYAIQSGRLRVGSAEQVDGDGFGRRTLRLGVWNGDAYCVKTFLYNRPTSDLIGVFGLVMLEERETGVVLRPDRSRGVSISIQGGYAPKVLKGIPGLGLLEVWQLTPERRRRFPPTGGAPGRGGRLYYDPPSVPDEDSLVLVGDSAVTRIYREHGLPDDSFAAAGADLRVTWS